MRVAAIQPYFLPYIGYFELLAAADVVVILDDVQFKRRGWINRNRIRSNNRPDGWRYLTIPVKRVPLDSCIDEIEMAVPSRWVKKLGRGLRLTYGNEATMLPLVQKLLSLEIRNGKRLLTFLLETLQSTMSMLDVDTPLHLASELEVSNRPGGEERLIALTHALGGSEYVNLPGGADLYDHSAFSGSGLKLHVLPLSQYRSETTHLPHLSVLDGLLSGEQSRMRRHLKVYAGMIRGRGVS